MTPDQNDSPRNIVICCDGTGNQVEGNLSNVMKLYRMAERTDRQRVFYDPGVGTIGNDSAWGRLRQRIGAVIGLATGAGLDDNIVHAYRFLCSTYVEGDRILLFGFSRGAYTVRALAGLIHMVGLLQPDQLNLADFALNAYKHAAETNDLVVAWDFGKMVGARKATIHFMGVWDTVASMIVPRPDRFYVPSLRMLPYTRFNPSVRAFRHAIAIDERRRMFRLNKWRDGQSFIDNPFAQPPEGVPQDSVQMWFAGVHADVGGGYPETESGLSKFPLEWVVNAAVEHGLRISAERFEELVHGRSREDARHQYVKPNAAAQLHVSLKGAWWLLELLPKSARWRETRRSFAGFYIPFGERRQIPPDALISPSVARRIEDVPSYRPKGLYRGQTTLPVVEIPDTLDDGI